MPRHGDTTEGDRRREGRFFQAREPFTEALSDERAEFEEALRGSVEESLLIIRSAFEQAHEQVELVDDEVFRQRRARLIRAEFGEVYFPLRLALRRDSVGGEARLPLFGNGTTLGVGSAPTPARNVELPEGGPLPAELPKSEDWTLDPLTGRAFEYTVSDDGRRAVIASSHSSESESEPERFRRVEILWPEEEK